MFFKDRIPNFPNRKKIIFEDDNSIRYATIEYADEPLQEGTPMNALLLDNIVPNGVILMWSGNSTNIPDGWALCDGKNGTPDLRGRFIIGESQKFPNQSVGGNETLNLEHNHTYSGETKRSTDDSVNGGGYNTEAAEERHTHSYSGTTEKSLQNVSILPPYYSLCYIMKITQMAQ